MARVARALSRVREGEGTDHAHGGDDRYPPGRIGRLFAEKSLDVGEEAVAWQPIDHAFALPASIKGQHVSRRFGAAPESGVRAEAEVAMPAADHTRPLLVEGEALVPDQR